MSFIGEFISLAVAVLWTVAALTCEVSSKRVGVAVTNVWRMLLGLVLSMMLCYIFMGSALPRYADLQTWAWLLSSGAVGFVVGDMCLLNSYMSIGSRYGQLFMTTAPIFSALSAWVLMGQRMTFMSIMAMIVTLLGIAISVLGRGEGKKRISLDLPLKGVLFGLGAGIGQGVGYVLSVIGLHHYTSIVPKAYLDRFSLGLPFSANIIRLVAGLLLFTVILVFKGKGGGFRRSCLDAKSMFYIVLAVLTGPVIGVGLSLMASQYTVAGVASTIMATTPIMILLPTYFLFHQPITLKSVLGAVISVLGVAMFFI